MALYSPQARLLISLLQKFNCLTIGQIKKIYGGTNFKVKPMLAHLCDIRLMHFVDDNFAMIQNVSSYNPETLYCIWVMLDKIENVKGIFNQSEINTAFPCDNGIEVCFLNKDRMEGAEDENIIEYITYIDNTSIAKLSLIQDTFYTATGVTRGNEGESHRRYTFVVQDENVMDIIANMDITVPFIVAYIEGDLTDTENEPIIEYYSL